MSPQSVCIDAEKWLPRDEWLALNLDKIQRYVPSEGSFNWLLRTRRPAMSQYLIHRRGRLWIHQDLVAKIPEIVLSA
jgi:hypothetical protein